MSSVDKNRSLLESTVELLKTELATENKDAFTKRYLEKRLKEVEEFLAAGVDVKKAQLQSAKNIVTNLNIAIDQNAAYDNPKDQFYRASVGDLKDELYAACESD